MFASKEKLNTEEILEKAQKGIRISKEEAYELYMNGDFLEIQKVAREIRNRFNKKGIVSYTAFRVVNYTNYCTIECSFCSFMDEVNSQRGYVLTKDEILKKMEEAIAMGARQMFFQGGVNPRIPFDYYLDVLSSVKKEFGKDIHIRGFSPVELINLEQITKLPLEEVLLELKQAGLDSVPGAGAEILTERMRYILSPKKASPSEWVRVMETCHKMGLKGSANIVFGSEETRWEVIEHLNLIRELQDRTGGFLSFIPWTFQKQTKTFYVRNVPSQEYLKVLAISRIFFDNIPHIETSLMVLGTGVGQIALHSGADDVSSIVIEENVLKSYGIKTEEGIRQFIIDSGFFPVKRDFMYNYDSGLV
ncbi:MAG: dehypoxanthine futalosine cyclase [Leptospiraceae bacterium]|nr:dehypoxanthine futalosine cyclase [Leptospiraceae bacterium]MDW7975120.1 cyclic dehypoxanthinyl futalosine synthase [Leptospiraceae bacterium]